jgi:hypothetical protein
MASLNGGFVGIDYEPESATQDAVITTFNSSGTLTTAAYTQQVEYLSCCRWSRWWMQDAGGGGAGGFRTVQIIQSQVAHLSSNSWCRRSWSTRIDAQAFAGSTSSFSHDYSQQVVAMVVIGC